MFRVRSAVAALAVLLAAVLIPAGEAGARVPTPTTPVHAVTAVRHPVPGEFCIRVHRHHHRPVWLCFTRRPFVPHPFLHAPSPGGVIFPRGF